MDFLIYLVVYVALIIVTDLLTPAPDVEDRAADQLGADGFPTASESRPIPVLFGDTWITGANVLWYGDVSIAPVTEKACSGTIFKSCTKYTVAYMYYVGMHCGLCHGKIDSFLSIMAGEDVIWTGDQADGVIDINQINLWGGNKSAGGVDGRIELISGGFDQDRNEYLVSQLGSEVPAYRGICAVIFRGFSETGGFYIGTAPVSRVFGYRIRTLPTSLSTDFHNINGQANPAHIIYELYTSQAYGGSAPAESLDVDSFLECAEALYNEGFGLKLQWIAQLRIEDIVSRLEQIIDCKLFPNVATGKISLKLIRDNYDPNTLPVLDESNILSFDNFSRSAWHETVNEVRINYNETTDTGNLDRCVIVQDLGNLHIQRGERVSITLNFPQIPTDAVASIVAGTQLKRRSYPLATCELTVNRSAFTLTPGSVFKLNWPSRGLDNIIMRVASQTEADVTKGTIKLTSIQDIFGLSQSVYSTPPPSAWIPPDKAPKDIIDSREDELPYMFNPTPEYSLPWLFVAAPSGLTLGYELWMGEGSYILEGDNLPCSPNVILQNDITQLSVTITVLGVVDLTSPSGGQSLGSTLFLLGDELISFLNASSNGDGTWDLTGCERGLLDTVPVDHISGEVVWLEAMEYGQQSVNVYSPTASVDIKYLTKTPAGVLDIAFATDHGTTFTQRANRPYPPGKIRVNGLTYDSEIPYIAATLSWNERNRLTQTEYIVDQDQVSIAHEVGTTYTLAIYDKHGDLLRTETGLTASPYNYLEADEKTDLGISDFSPQLTFKIKSIRDGLISWQEQEITFSRADIYWPLESHPDWYLVDGLPTSTVLIGDTRIVFDDITIDGSLVSFTETDYTDPTIRGTLEFEGNDTTTESFFMVIRALDSDNFIGVRSYNGVLEVYEIISGIPLKLLTSSPSNIGTTGKVISLTVVGTLVTLIVDGISYPCDVAATLASAGRIGVMPANWPSTYISVLSDFEIVQNVLTYNNEPLTHNGELLTYTP